MKSVDYTYSLTEEDRLRSVFQKRRGKITYFIVQYHALIHGQWRSIMRYDTCHGYAHRHTFYMRGGETVTDLTKPGDDLNGLFTQAIQYIKTDFKEIKYNFLGN